LPAPETSVTCHFPAEIARWLEQYLSAASEQLNHEYFQQRQRGRARRSQDIRQDAANILGASMVLCQAIERCHRPGEIDDR
jgi:hypothetical protein